MSVFHGVINIVFIRFTMNLHVKEPILIVNVQFVCPLTARVCCLSLAVPKGVAVSINNGYFRWERDASSEAAHDTELGVSSQHSLLSNISIEVPQGALAAVVGTVGAGKSSLLSAMLGEMIRDEGEVNLKVSQCRCHVHVRELLIS